jgi:aspartate/methionine/tyrosine aminotransferase
MNYQRMPIEIESPEEMGYGNIRFNLAESAVRDLKLSDLGFSMSDLVLCYGEHRGETALRDLIVAGQDPLSKNDVLTTTGAALALFIVSTTLLRRDDHLVVIRPNYATNLETPRAIGCGISIVDLSFETGYQLDIQQIKAVVQLISLTTPHNPTGRVLSQNAILELANWAAERGIVVLVDETYRDIVLEVGKTPSPYFAAFSDNIISVCSLSKAYGIPGIRVGWLICRNPDLMHRFLAAKEQICIGGSVLDEAVATTVLANKTQILEPLLARTRSNWAITADFFSQMPYLECHKPDAGAVCFPRLTPSVNFDFEGFKKAIFDDYQTVVGFGHWFEQPANYFRIGFGYPLEAELREGLVRFRACLERFIG